MAFAETFKALSDPVRREILVLLKKKTFSRRIGKHFEMTGSNDLLSFENPEEGQI